MKFYSLLLIAFLSLPATLKAQDLITTRSGEDIKGRVTEIGLTEVKYQPWESPEGTVSKLPKESILLIRYQDGGKEIFERAAPLIPNVIPDRSNLNETGVVSALNNSSMFMRGQLDAKRYYRGYQGAGTASLLGTLFLGPIFGLILPITLASREPALTDLNYPSESSIQNGEYARGYTLQAQKIKSDKVWLNYAIGAGIPVVIGLLVLGLFLASY